MKYKNNHLFITISAILFLGAIMTTIEGCAVSAKITAKTGVQLWSENCQRCHNTPPPNTFSPEQWETIGLHMQSRALLTDIERNKIIDFLQQ